MPSKISYSLRKFEAKFSLLSTVASVYPGKVKTIMISLLKNFHLPTPGTGASPALSSDKNRLPSFNLMALKKILRGEATASLDRIIQYFRSSTLKSRLRFTASIFVCCGLTPTVDHLHANQLDDISPVLDSALVQKYIVTQSKPGSFNYSSNIFVNVRTDDPKKHEKELSFVSWIYKFYSRYVSLTAVEGRIHINIIVMDDVIKDVKNGKFYLIDKENGKKRSDHEYCYVESEVSLENEDEYVAANIFLDPSMRGDPERCIRESFAGLFGFKVSFSDFVRENGKYSGEDVDKYLELIGVVAIKIRQDCLNLIKTEEYKNCVARGLGRD